MPSNKHQIQTNKDVDKDEWYTPKYLVEPLLNCIGKNKIIWCPFDTSKSEFVLVLKSHGCKVIHSHIATGKNFFEYEPEEKYDFIISNIPFSSKKEVFSRCFDELKKPFALLLRLGCLEYQVIGNYFYEREEQLQLYIPDKKVSFDGNTSSFNTCYFGWNFFEKDLDFFHLPHNNTGKNFKKSSMEVHRKKTIESLKK